MVNEAANGSKPQNVPSYVNESGYTEDITGRTNVGDTQNRQRVAILDVATGESKFVDPGIANREMQMQAPVWNEQGTKAVMVVALDRRTIRIAGFLRWIRLPARPRTLFTEHDDAWLGMGRVRRPSVGSKMATRFISKASATAIHTPLHARLRRRRAPEATFTSGKWEVSSVELSNDGTKFYLTTSEIDPGERQFYSMSVTGGARTKITTESGGHRVMRFRPMRSSWRTFTRSPTNRRSFSPAITWASARSRKKLTSSPAKDFSPITHGRIRPP